jgi:hypothetical protein
MVQGRLFGVGRTGAARLLLDEAVLVWIILARVYDINAYQ